MLFLTALFRRISLCTRAFLIVIEIISTVLCLFGVIKLLFIHNIDID